MLAYQQVKKHLEPSSKANDFNKAVSYLKNCVLEKSSKSLLILSVDSRYKRKIQAEIKALKHTMNERPIKGSGGGKTDSKEVPNKKLVSRHKNNKTLSKTEKRTIAYRVYTFRDWQSLSHDLHSDIADWQKEIGYKGTPKKISSGSTNRGYANKCKLSALELKIAKLSNKVAAMPDEEESDPDHKNPSNLIKNNHR